MWLGKRIDNILSRIDQLFDGIKNSLKRKNCEVIVIHMTIYFIGSQTAAQAAIMLEMVCPVRQAGR